MNILLVVLDTARRDAFEPYGGPLGATPAVAQLAGRGTAFPRAYATASWTLPSHASMFTGLLPRQLGLTQPPDGTPQSAQAVLRRSADRMLGRVLSDAGFATLGWSTNVWASPAAGLDIGFDHFEYVNSGRDERMNALLAGGRRARLAWAMEGLRATSDDGAEAVRRRLRASIDSARGRPHFWFVNLCECHSPYLPPRPWNDLPASERIRAALEIKQYLTFESICRYVAGDLEVPEEAFARMRHLYARAISYMDAWLADILDALDARRILDETLVVVTSDHGENFGEDGLIAHGFSLSQALCHMPLVMAGPGAVPDEGVVSLAELPAMLARAAGVDDHPYGGAGLPGGVAVAQLDPMAAAGDPRVRAFATKFDVEEAGVQRLCARFTAVTDGSTKLVVRNGEELVYDLERDSGAGVPLDTGSERDAAVAELRSVLALPGVTEAAAPTPAAPAAGPEPPRASEAELAAIERQMKLLGYL